MDVSGPIVDAFVDAGFFLEDHRLPIPDQLMRDADSRAASGTAAGSISYVFGDSTALRDVANDPDRLLAELDRWNIRRAQVPVYPWSDARVFEVIDAHADRLFATLRIRPYDGYPASRAVADLLERWPWIRSVSVVPSIQFPQLAPNSREYFPIYTRCIDLDVPILLNVGFPAPRVPSAVQDPIHLEDVLWFFPELTVVMKHGGEPWTATCVKMMQKWPNLHFMTSGFTPRRYPPEIVEYLRGRGADRVLYGGYFPFVPYEKAMAELGAIELDDERARAFLHDNAARVFRWT